MRQSVSRVAGALCLMPAVAMAGLLAGQSEPQDEAQDQAGRSGAVRQEYQQYYVRPSRRVEICIPFLGGVLVERGRTRVDMPFVHVDTAGPEQVHIDQRPWLGVMLGQVPPAVADQFPDLVQDGMGAFVTDVVRDSPADRAGLTPRAVILKYNDQQVGSYEQLIDFILNDQPNTTVRLQILQHGQIKDIDVVLAARQVTAPGPAPLQPREPLPEPQPSAEPAPPRPPGSNPSDAEPAPAPTPGLEPNRSQSDSSADSPTTTNDQQAPAPREKRNEPMPPR